MKRYYDREAMSQVLRFTWPALLANLVYPVAASFNTLWIGRYLGESALALSVTCNFVAASIVGIMSGFGQMAAILVAQASGARADDRGRRVIASVLTLYVALLVPITIVQVYIADDILRWMQLDAGSSASSRAYFVLLSLTIPVICALQLLNVLLRAAGDPRTGYRYALAAIILDVVLNPVLIFGFGPVPAMGLVGSAIAALIAFLAATAGFLFRLRRHALRARLAPQRLHLDWSIGRSLLGGGALTALQSYVVSVLALGVAVLCNRQGAIAAAAYGASLQVWQYVQLPALSVSGAVTVLVASRIGERQWHQASGIAWAGVLFNCMLGTALVAVGYVWGRELVTLFLPAASPAIDLASRINATVLWSFILSGAAAVLLGAIRGTGRIGMALAILSAALWGINLPLAFWLAQTSRPALMWWSYGVSAAFMLAAAAMYYRSSLVALARGRSLAIGAAA